MELLVIYSIIIFTFAVIKLIVDVIKDHNFYEIVIMIIITVFSIIVFAISLELTVIPTAEDVYNGKTTLEYRVRDG